MNATQLTKEQLADLKREFAHLMIGDMSPKELFEFAIHRITCDVAMMRQKELKDHIDEYDESTKSFYLTATQHGRETNGLHKKRTCTY